MCPPSRPSIPQVQEPDPLPPPPEPTPEAPVVSERPRTGTKGDAKRRGVSALRIKLNTGSAVPGTASGQGLRIPS